MQAWMQRQATTSRGFLWIVLMTALTLALGLCPRIHNLICPNTPWDRDIVFSATVEALRDAAKTVPVEGRILDENDLVNRNLGFWLYITGMRQDKSAQNQLVGADTTATNNKLAERMQSAEIFDLVGLPAVFPSYAPDSLASLLVYWMRRESSIVVGYVPHALADKNGFLSLGKFNENTWESMRGFASPYGRSADPDSLLRDTRMLLERFVSANKTTLDSVDIGVIMARTEERLFHHVRHLRENKWYVLPIAICMLGSAFFCFGIGVVPAIRQGRSFHHEALERFPTASAPPYWSIVASTDFDLTLKVYRRNLLEEKRAWQRQRKGRVWEEEDQRRTKERVANLETERKAFLAGLTPQEAALPCVVSLLDQVQQDDASIGMRTMALLMARRSVEELRSVQQEPASVGTRSVLPSHQKPEKRRRVRPVSTQATKTTKEGGNDKGIFSPQTRDDIVAGLEVHDLVPNEIPPRYVSAILVLGILEGLRRGRVNIGERYRAVEILREDVARYFSADFNTDNYEVTFWWLVRNRVVEKRKNKRHQVVFSLNPHARNATPIGGTVIRRTLRYQHLLSTTIHN